jgi:hypothetical protein
MCSQLKVWQNDKDLEYESIGSHFPSCLLLGTTVTNRRLSKPISKHEKCGLAVEGTPRGRVFGSKIRYQLIGIDHAIVQASETEKSWNELQSLTFVRTRGTSRVFYNSQVCG